MEVKRRRTHRRIGDDSASSHPLGPGQEGATLKGQGDSILFKIHKSLVGISLDQLDPGPGIIDSAYPGRFMLVSKSALLIPTPPHHPLPPSLFPSLFPLLLSHLEMYK